MFEQTDKYDSQFTINEGENSDFSLTKSEVLALNQKAMDCMNRGNFKHCQALLTKAETIVAQWSYELSRESSRQQPADEAQGSNYHDSTVEENEQNEKIKLMSITYNNFA